MAALQRLAQMQALIEVDHDGHVVADGLAHRVVRRQIVGDAVAPHAQLQAPEAALVAQLDGLGRDGGRFLQP